MTTDLQRMHQDEWLAALRSGDYKQGAGGRKLSFGKHCVLQVGVATLGGDPSKYLLPFCEQCGVSAALAQQMYALNDGWQTMNPTPGRRWSFDEIADWFKAERDAHDGDLSDWRPV